MSLNNDASLILHLKLDEVAGVTTAVNAANPGTYDGTVAGGATIDYAKGKYRNGITRTVAGDNISCGAVSELVDTDQSFAFWFKHTATSGTLYMLSTRDGTKGGITLFKNSDTTILPQIAVTNQTSWSTPTISNGAWHHVAVVYDAAPTRTLYGYIDGVLSHTDATLSGTFETPASTVAFMAFERVGGTSAGDASIDDLRVYTRMLTLNEIRQLAQNPYNAINQGIAASISPSIAYSPATTNL